jgi:DNA-binding transcriptional regulator YdaS (Cro superfamily)
MNVPGLSLAQWHKGTRSSANGACVEVARSRSGTVAVRDSKDPDGPKLAFTADEWEAFAAGVRDGEFDLT